MLANGCLDASEQESILYSIVCNQLATVFLYRKIGLLSSKRPVIYYHELLVLVWHLLNINRGLLKRAVTSMGISQCLTVTLCYLLLDSTVATNSNTASSLSVQQIQQERHRRFETKSGLIHTCAFILLLLSGEREYAVSLNTEYSPSSVSTSTGRRSEGSSTSSGQNERISLGIGQSIYIPPSDLGLPYFDEGTFADLLVLTIYKTVFEAASHPLSDSLIDMLLTTFSNISPYVQTLSQETCVKLIVLLERLIKPSWLYAGKYRFQSIQFILEGFTNLIQYQYQVCICYAVDSTLFLLY